MTTISLVLIALQITLLDRLEEPQKKMMYACAYISHRKQNACTKETMIGYRRIPMSAWRPSCVEQYPCCWTRASVKHYRSMDSWGCIQVLPPECWIHKEAILSWQPDSKRRNWTMKHITDSHMTWETNYMRLMFMLYSQLDSSGTLSTVKTPKRKNWVMQLKWSLGCLKCGIPYPNAFPTTWMAITESMKSGEGLSVPWLTFVRLERPKTWRIEKWTRGKESLKISQKYSTELARISTTTFLKVKHQMMTQCYQIFLMKLKRCKKKMTGTKWMNKDKMNKKTLRWSTAPKMKWWKRMKQKQRNQQQTTRWAKKRKKNQSSKEERSLKWWNPSSRKEFVWHVAALNMRCPNVRTKKKLRR